MLWREIKAVKAAGVSWLFLRKYLGKNFCDKVIFNRNLKELKEKTMQTSEGRMFAAEEK